MGRPTKATVDYFPHYTKHGKTMYIIERKFGNDGYAVWFKTLEMLGANENQFIDCRNIESWEYLLAKIGVDENTAIQIYNCLADVQAISKGLWKNRIIFSENFIKNVEDLYRRRKQLLPTSRVIYSLCGIKNPVSVDTNEVSVNKKPQNKTKQSKTKQNKKREGLTLGEFLNVFLSVEEHKKLQEKFGKAGAVDRIERLSGYIASKGDKYKSHYATILQWARKDAGKEEAKVWK